MQYWLPPPIHLFSCLDPNLPVRCINHKLLIPRYALELTLVDEAFGEVGPVYNSLKELRVRTPPRLAQESTKRYNITFY